MISPVPVLLIAAAVGLACRSEPKTAEEKKAKGDQILREMSNAVAAVKNFSFTAEVVSEQVGRWRPEDPGRDVSGTSWCDGRTASPFDDRRRLRESAAWYDGKSATIVSDDKKRWARGPMPPTLDEAMDYAAAVYDLKLAWGDLLYSSPYDALMTAGHDRRLGGRGDDRGQGLRPPVLPASGRRLGGLGGGHCTAPSGCGSPTSRIRDSR